MLPFFNEGKRFKMQYFERLFSSIDQEKWILLLVNDGSTDNTSDLLNQICDKYRCLILELQQNVGKSNAVRLGMNEAMEMLPRLAYVGFLDSDGAFAIEDICSLTTLAMESNNDLIIGSRIKMAGTIICRSALRHFVGRIIATILNQFVLEKSIYDPQSGFKLFRVSEKLRLSLSKPFKTRWFGDIELITNLWSLSSLVIKECPVTEWKDVKGGNLKISSVFAITKELYVVFRTCNASLRGRKWT